ncbi:hypothetical protein ACFLUA_01785 [Chloroflexota bacterium]
MRFEEQRKILLIIIAIPMVISLACNFPGINQPAPEEVGQIPVTTESVKNLDDNIQSVIEDIQNGGPFQLIVTESQLTSYANYELQSYQEYQIQNVQIYLRDGQVRITGDVEQNNINLPLTIVLQLSVDGNGKPESEIISASIGPFQIPDSFLDQLTSMMDSILVNQILPANQNVVIEQITINNGQMIISGYTR